MFRRKKTLLKLFMIPVPLNLRTRDIFLAPKINLNTATREHLVQHKMIILSCSLKISNGLLHQVKPQS